eukprot:5106744-Pleurochrysis_carterae.AAC.2
MATPSAFAPLLNVACTLCLGEMLAVVATTGASRLVSVAARVVRGVADMVAVTSAEEMVVEVRPGVEEVRIMC